MKGFLNWSVRYTRNKFYKILLFFILFIILSFFVSSCKVHALALPSTESLIYSQTQNCDLDSSSPANITCSKGTTYKFLFNTNKTDNNSIYITPMILNTNEHNILIQNLVYDIKLDQTYTIGSDEYIFLEIPFENNSFMYKSDSRYSLNMFPSDSLDSQNNIDKRATFPINFGYKPYFCSYFDTNVNELKTCDMFLQWQPGSKFDWALNLPEGTSLDRFIVYFGTNDIYSGTSQIFTPNTNYLPSFKVPNINNLFVDSVNYHNFTQNNLSYLYGSDFSNFRNYTNNSNYPYGPLWWYPKDILLFAPEFSLPDYDSFVQKGSISYNNQRKEKQFTTLYTVEQQTILNNNIINIEEEFNEQQGISETWFNDSMSGFINSDQSNSFINIFNSIVTYPFQKLHNSLTSDLFETGSGNIQNGTLGINLGFCTGTTVNNGSNEDRLKIPFYKNISWDFPCIHYDVYSKMYNENFSFYPASIDGVYIQNGNNDHNFYSIYRIIIRGFLVLCLYKACLDIYHYILDSDRKDIEVLDL